MDLFHNLKKKTTQQTKKQKQKQKTKQNKQTTTTTTTKRFEIESANILITYLQVVCIWWLYSNQYRPILQIFANIIITIVIMVIIMIDQNYHLSGGSNPAIILINQPIFLQLTVFVQALPTCE